MTYKQPRLSRREPARAESRNRRGMEARGLQREGRGSRGCDAGSSPRSAPAKGAASTRAHGCPEGPPSRNPCPFGKTLTSRAGQRACQFNVAKT